MLTNSDPRQRSSRQLTPTNRQIWCWIGALSAVLLSGLSIYYRMFTGFSSFDDDGYVLIGLRSLVNGHRLYDEIYSQYGPFYYLANWTVYSVLDQAVSHDLERWIGVALWLLSSVLWARTVYLLTHSPFWSGIGFVLTVRILSFFPGSAGHPEEICMALLSAVAVLACGLRTVRAASTVAALACLVAAITLTKVNLGIYVALALGLVLLNATVPTRLQRFAAVSVVLAGLILPAALMSQTFDLAWTQNYAIVATGSIGAAVVISWTAAPVGEMTARALRSALLWFITFSLLVVAPFYVRGTTLPALFQMTVLQHAGSAHQWYIPARVRSRNLVWMGASLAALGIVYLGRIGRLSRDLGSAALRASPVPAMPSRLISRIRSLCSSAYVQFGLLGLRVFIGLICLRVLIGNITTAYYPFSYCVPFAWLILVQPADEMPRHTRGGRIALCFLTVFVYLYAYPVAGAQVFFASVPAGILAVVLLRDAALIISGLVPAEWLRRTLQFSPPIGFAILLMLISRELYDAHRAYTTNVPLGMPGATRIRVKPQEAAAYRWINGNVASCSALYSMPGLFSLNFWTAKESPTDLNVGNWVVWLNVAQQRAVIRDLSRYQGLCIVYNPVLVEFWRRGQDLAQSPLAQYINTEFVPVADSYGYFIMRRKTVKVGLLGSVGH